MGGSSLSSESFFQQFPNASDKVYEPKIFPYLLKLKKICFFNNRPEDDLIRTFRVIEPEPLAQKFLYPIWKIMSSHNDYLLLERYGKAHLGSNALNNSAENMLFGVTQKTKRVCKIIESHKNFLVKIFERTDYLKQLYFCRLKYISEEAVIGEGDLIHLPIHNIPGQPDNEMITYAMTKDLESMVSAYRQLITMQNSVQMTLVQSFNNLIIWHSNFEDLSLRCKLVCQMFMENKKQELEPKS